MLPLNMFQLIPQKCNLINMYFTKRKKKNKDLFFFFVNLLTIKHKLEIQKITLKYTNNVQQVHVAFGNQ